MDFAVAKHPNPQFERKSIEILNGEWDFGFQKARWKCIKSLYRCLVISMISGRIVWGIVQCILLGLGNDGFTLSMFLSGAIINAIPGIILQLLLIPTVMLMLGKTHLVHMKKE